MTKVSVSQYDQDRQDNREQVEYLDSVHEYVCVVSVCDEASKNLGPEQKLAFRRMGLQLDDLPYRGSYIGIAYQGEKLWEQMEKTETIRVWFKAGQTIGPITLAKPLFVWSAGYKSGKVASIRVDDVEQAFNKRGFNICVLDDTMTLLEVAHFDTFKDTTGVVISFDP